MKRSTLFLTVTGLIFSSLFAPLLALSPPEMKEVLTNERWQLNRQFLTTKEAMVVDYMKSIKECKKDDEFVFKPDGTYEVYSSDVLCSDGEPELSGTGTWKLNDQQELTVEFLGGKPLTRKITDMNPTRIELEQVRGEGTRINWVYHNATAEIIEEETEAPYEAPYAYAKMLETHLKDRFRGQVGFVTIDLESDDPGQRAEIRLARAKGKAVIGFRPFTEGKNEPADSTFSNTEVYDCDLLIGGQVREVTTSETEPTGEDSLAFSAIVEYELLIARPDKALAHIPIIASNEKEEEKRGISGSKLLKAGIAVAATAATVYLAYNGVYLGLNTMINEVNAINQTIDQQGEIDEEQLREELGEQDAVMQAVINSGEEVIDEMKSTLAVPVTADEVVSTRKGAISTLWVACATPGLFAKGDRISLSPLSPNDQAWNNSRSTSNITATVRKVSAEEGRMVIQLEDGRAAFDAAHDGGQKEWTIRVNE